MAENINSDPPVLSSIEEIPAKDPRNKHYLKVCFVCQEEAKPDKNSKIPQFSCKNNDCCTVTPKNRRRCQSCRYKLCLQAGMKPELVLSEDPKLIRFRKLIHRKKMGLVPVTRIRETIVRPEEACQPSTSGLSSQRNAETSSLPSGSSLPILDPDLSLGDVLNEVINSGLIPKDVLYKTSEIVDSYKSAIFQCLGGEFSQYFENLAGFHLGEFELHLDKRDVLANMVSLSTIFYQFALQQSEFQMLSNIDQKKLMDRNMPLYIQLLIASYFGAENGAEQLQFICNFCNCSSANQSTREVFFMSLQNFNTISKLFKFDSDLVYYCDLIAKVRSVCLSGIEQQALMAYMVLFDCFKELKNSHVLKVIAKKYEMIFDFCVEKVNTEVTMEEISSWLVKMAVFSSYNIIWSENNTSSPESILTMAYTEEEERWLHNQVNLLDKAFRSVSMGEEIMDEVAMYSLGVPLSKSYLSNVFAVCNERVWRIFQTQSEFLDLTFQLQLQLVMRNSMMIFCLFNAKWESYETGTEQIQFGNGILDSENWSSKYTTVFGQKELKKIGCIDSSYDLQNGLSDAQKFEMTKAYKDLAGLIKDPSIYVLMLLIASSQPITEVSIRPIEKQNSNYSLHLRRRLSSQLSWKQKQMDPTQVEARISKGFSDIEKLANILSFLSVQN